ncbi:hypothetical protein FACS1894202_01830 [Clostridia bacterium]|nr:hypothetical protein FACS1894202_01830 [Clostridia bacterium]
MDTYEFFGAVELFPQDKGWHYVRVPMNLSKPFEHLADRGLIAITASIGNSKWKTSQLPMGDGSHFLALPAKVRKKECINLGDVICVKFALRERG